MSYTIYSKDAYVNTCMSFKTQLTQVLSELYHVQPPLVEEDSARVEQASTSQPTSDSPQCGQPSTQGVSVPDASTPLNNVTGAASDTFISRQQLGINDAPDAAFTDSGLLEDAVTATADATPAGVSQAPASSPAESAQDPDQVTAKSDQAATKPLCSQEWKIQHVSFGLPLSAWCCSCGPVTNA